MCQSSEKYSTPRDNVSAVEGGGWERGHLTKKTTADASLSEGGGGGAGGGGVITVCNVNNVSGEIFREVKLSKV